jgi:cytochrome c peroxidase
MEYSWLVVLVMVGCMAPESAPLGDDLPPGPDAGVDDPASPPGPMRPVLPATPAPDPADNPRTPAKIALGRDLFFDPILSGDRTTACATCHDPQRAFTDGRATPPGVARNSMTVLNTAWNGLVDVAAPPDPAQAPMFWDNRTHSLEAQAKGPITAAAEMMGTSYTAQTIFPELVARLSASPAYSAKFEAAFGQGSVSEDTIVKAIAAYERTLVTAQTSFDRGALSPQARAGGQIFATIGCTNCHSGPMFSDYKLHRLRGELIRTPSLRNVTRTAPYMHDGALATLPNLFQFYRQATQNPVDPDLRGVRTPTPQEAPAVEAFLAALGDAPPG